jgi:hypothetical protein
MRLKNPTPDKSTFLYNSKEYSVGPMSISDRLPEEVINHYQQNINGPLQIVTEEDVLLEKTPDYENMKFSDLIKIANELGKNFSGGKGTKQEVLDYIYSHDRRPS